MDVRDHTTASDGSLDEGVELLIASDGELEVSGCDSLHLEVLAGIAGELQDLSSQVLKDSCSINGRSGSNSAVSANSTLQESVNSSNGELSSDKKMIEFELFCIDLLTCSPARADLVCGDFLFLAVNLPPLPFPPFPA